MDFFNGKKIRDEILKELAGKVALSGKEPVLAEFLVGDDPVSKSYVELKKKLATSAGIQFCLYSFAKDAEEKEITECIDYLNEDEETDGLFIQIPMPKQFDRKKIIEHISVSKDVDGLRFCQELDSKFYPPVVLAILEALARSQNPNTEYRISKQIQNLQILKSKKIAVIGKGFLVGSPLLKALEKEGIEADSFDRNSEEMAKKLAEYDIIVSATGKAGIIQPEMVKEGVVLIDAGTAEENGELKGDIDPKCYKKASYYTPVPGGIGPVTVAMLFKNLIAK